jgi:hypothetical protein
LSLEDKVGDNYTIDLMYVELLTFELLPMSFWLYSGVSDKHSAETILWSLNFDIFTG